MSEENLSDKIHSMEAGAHFYNDEKLLFLEDVREAVKKLKEDLISSPQQLSKGTSYALEAIDKIFGEKLI